MTASAAIRQEAQSERLESLDFQLHMGRVTRHSLIFFLGMIFNGVAAYLFKVYLARELGASALGIYALGMTLVGVASLFNTLGLSQAAVRFVSSYSATQKWDLLRGFLGRSIFLLLGLNCILGVGLWAGGRVIAIRFYHSPELVNYLGLFSLVMVLGVFTTFFGHVLAGYKDIAGRTMISTFVGSPATMLIAVVLIAAGFGLRGYIAAQVFSAVLVLTLLAGRTWRLTPVAVRTLSGKLAGMEKEVVSLSAATLGLAVLGFAMGHADAVIVGHYHGAREMGIYAVTTAIVAFGATVLTSVNQIFAPTIADIYARGQHEMLLRMFQMLTKWILGLSLPLAAVLVIFPASLMSIFGKDFESGSLVLVIGALGQLVNCAVGSSGTLLYMTGHQRHLVWIHAVAAFLTVLLSLLLVPRWGIVGAGVAAAMNNVVANLLYLICVKRFLNLQPYNQTYLRLGLPALVMLITLGMIRAWVLPSSPNWLAVAMALILSYSVFIGLTLLLGLNADDRLIARAIWTRARGMFLGTGVAG